jgi:oxygen-independent coproporphyrinogen-3 oxidase
LGEGANTGRRYEITLELNPDDVTEEYVAALKGTWFNRFSIGIQSFFDDELKYLNRTHSAEQAVLAVKLLQEAGYTNISIDLIYGLPDSSPERWEKNLEMAFSLGVPHISAYALTVEEKTPLAWMIGRGRSAPVNDEVQAGQFRTLMKQAREAGYIQYEISNFCLPGQHARHNTNYWQGVPYLGLGPSAHSYNGFSRRWNVSSITRYVDAMNSGTPAFEEELLTQAQRYNEYIMTSMRTMWGTEVNKLILDFGLRISELFEKQADTFVRQGLMTEQSGVFFLTDEGKLFADRIAAELFCDE